MKKSMFEYTKIILQKVSFDRKLFIKEYRKAQALLQPQEVQELRVWVRSNMFPWQPNR
ncbi:MAG: hypothetical protein JNM57_08535 [Cyclobacteriaceae bacterium]|nr:hypothetical protein [Cyclobacteriaceae bacterium]